EDHVLEVAAALLRNDLGQLLQRVGGEIVAIAMGDARKLIGDRGIDLFVAVANAIDGRPARSVDIALALRVMDIAALGPFGLWQVGRRRGDALGKWLLRHALSP